MANGKQTDVDPRVRAAFREVADRMLAIQQSQMAVAQMIHSTRPAEAAKRNGGMFSKVVEILHAIAAVTLVVCLLTVLLWAMPQVKGRLEKLAEVADRPAKLPLVMVQSLGEGKSLTTNQGDTPVALTHAIMLRVPADRFGIAPRYLALDEVFREYGGWSRWRVERRSDRNDDDDRGQIAEKFMYFVALSPEQVSPAVARLEPVLKEYFATDHMLITISLADRTLPQLIPAAPVVVSVDLPAPADEPIAQPAPVAPQ